MSARLVTPRQASVLNLLAEGKTNKQIATALNCAERTIKEHIRHLMWKLQIEDRRRVTLAQYWLCQLFRLGAGYETSSSTLGSARPERVRTEEDSEWPLGLD